LWLLLGLVLRALFDEKGRANYNIDASSARCAKTFTIALSKKKIWSAEEQHRRPLFFVFSPKKGF